MMQREGRDFGYVRVWGLGGFEGTRALEVVLPFCCCFLFFEGGSVAVVVLFGPFLFLGGR